MSMFRYLEKPEQISDYLGSLKFEAVVAIDFEASSLFTYKEKICLAQISTRDEVAIVDALSSPRALKALGPVLADPKIEKIFHGGDYDIRLLKKEYGFEISNIFDTMPAAQLTGREKVGLAALLEENFQVNTDKKYQRSDWTARPLSADQLAYAALDVEYLIQLKELLENELKALGRHAWAMEEFQLLEAVAPTERKQPWCRDVKGARKLPPEQLGRLQSLLEMREIAAESWDRPSFKTISNSVLLAWAENPPKNRKEIEDNPSVGRKAKRTLCDKILYAVENPKDISNDARNRPAPGQAYEPLNADQEKRLKKLKKARTETSRQLGIDPGLLVNTATLERLARKEPDQIAEEMTLCMKKWQLEAIGEALRDSIRL